MRNPLKGKRVAILVADGFEQVELLQPKKALERAGASTHIISPAEGTVRGWNHSKWGKKLTVDRPLDTANPEDYDALLLPGGVMNPDKLRMDTRAVDFVKHFVMREKPIAAICHGPWTLIEAGAVSGRTLTSWPSLKTDIQNAGGHWIDKEVVSDARITTSRQPDDLPAFNIRMIEEFTRAAGSSTVEPDRRTA